MQTTPDASATKLIVVIDDDPLVLEGMGGLLKGWGYRVILADSDDAALLVLAERKERPDLIVCDYRLSAGRIGTDAIQAVRHLHEIPAILISGEAVPDGLAQAFGQHLMHKPVNPAGLRRLLMKIFKR